MSLKSNKYPRRDAYLQTMRFLDLYSKHKLLSTWTTVEHYYKTPLYIHPLPLQSLTRELAQQTDTYTTQVSGWSRGLTASCYLSPVV